MKKDSVELSFLRPKLSDIVFRGLVNHWLSIREASQYYLYYREFADIPRRTKIKDVEKKLKEIGSKGWSNTQIVNDKRSPEDKAEDEVIGKMINFSKDLVKSKKGKEKKKFTLVGQVQSFIKQLEQLGWLEKSIQPKTTEAISKLDKPFMRQSKNERSRLNLPKVFYCFICQRLLEQEEIELIANTTSINSFLEFGEKKLEEIFSNEKTRQFIAIQTIWPEDNFRIRSFLQEVVDIPVMVSLLPKLKPHKYSFAEGAIEFTNKIREADLLELFSVISSPILSKFYTFYNKKQLKLKIDPKKLKQIQKIIRELYLQRSGLAENSRADNNLILSVLMGEDL